MDRRFDRGGGVRRIYLGADNNREKRPGKLIEGNIHSHSRRLFKMMLLYIPDDADNLTPNLVVVAARASKALTYRILPRPKVVRRRRTDDRHRQRAGGVTILKSATAQQRDVHGPKIVWCHDQIVRRGVARGRSRAPLDFDGSIAVAGVQRQP